MDSPPCCAAQRLVTRKREEWNLKQSLVIKVDALRHQHLAELVSFLHPLPDVCVCVLSVTDVLLLVFQLSIVNLTQSPLSLSRFSHFKAAKAEPISLIQCKYEPHAYNSPSRFLAQWKTFFLHLFRFTRFNFQLNWSVYTDSLAAHFLERVVKPCFHCVCTS